MQKILKHQQAEPAPLDTFRADVPAALTALLKRMMAKDPEERYQTPAALARTLLPFTRGGTVPSVAAALASRKGTAPVKHKDDTPLPMALGGERNRAVPRLSHRRES